MRAPFAGEIFRLRAPAQASRRSTYVRSPSFHTISCLRASRLLQLRESMDSVRDSKLSSPDESVGMIGLGGEYEESESRSRHSATLSSE